jgi:hypothetical protein
MHIGDVNNPLDFLNGSGTDNSGDIAADRQSAPPVSFQGCLVRQYILFTEHLAKLCGRCLEHGRVLGSWFLQP